MDRIARIVDQVYDGALDSGAWPAAHTSICELMDANHAISMLRSFPERRAFDSDAVIPRAELLLNDFFNDYIRPMGGYRGLITIPTGGTVSTASSRFAAASTRQTSAKRKSQRSTASCRTWRAHCASNCNSMRPRQGSRRLSTPSI
jgi:hypothetical protein